MTLAQEPGKQETGKRRGGGFRRPAEEARAQLGQAAAKHGFAEPEVLLRWHEIVGEKLSGLCAPVKVTYPRDQGLAATLVVRSDGPRATEIEHMGPQIVERVNQFYGYRAIGRVKVVQTTGPAPGFAEPPRSFTGPDVQAEPPPDATARAAEMTTGIRDPNLRAALTRMGAHVLTRKDSRNSRT